MNRERDPFELSSLPPVTPPGDGWPEIATVLQKRQRKRLATAWIGAAAVIALAIGIGIRFSRNTPETQTSVQNAANEVQPAEVNPASREAVTAQDNLVALIGLSQQLERNVRLVRAEIDAMPAQSVVYQIELEDLVAQVDDALSLDPDSRELWSQRVNLLLDLEQLYQRELRRHYSSVASL